jgi:hypothetical protein
MRGGAGRGVALRLRYSTGWRKAIRPLAGRVEFVPIEPPSTILALPHEGVPSSGEAMTERRNIVSSCSQPILGCKAGLNSLEHASPARRFRRVKDSS